MIEIDLWRGKPPKDFVENLRRQQARLVDTVTELCLNALRVAEARKTLPLNPVQIDQMIEIELNCIKEDMEKPGFIEAVYEISKKKYEEQQGR